MALSSGFRHTHISSGDKCSTVSGESPVTIMTCMCHSNPQRRAWRWHALACPDLVVRLLKSSNDEPRVLPDEALEGDEACKLELPLCLACSRARLRRIRNSLLCASSRVNFSCPAGSCLNARARTWRLRLGSAGALVCAGARQTDEAIPETTLC